MSVNDEPSDPSRARPSAVDLDKRATSNSPSGAPSSHEGLAEPSVESEPPRGEQVASEGEPGEIDANQNLEPGAEAGAEPDKKRKPSASRTIVEWLLVVGGAVLIALVVKTFLFQAFYIPTGSMEPTLMVGDRILVNKLSYKLHDVHRGDIIVFERPDNASTGTIEDLIKRVVGLPGETIEVRRGEVYIDGEKLDESYLPEGVTTPPFAKTTVPEGHLFVLGDNRGDSQASNVFGPIDEDLIVGRAFVRVWPVGDLGGI